MVPQGSTARRYLRSRVLGRGSTATVYYAHDQLLDRPVALKEIHLPNGQSVMLAEARAAAGICHQNVVTIHDVVEDESGSFIAMELLDGPTLAEVLHFGGMEPHDALRVACDIAAGIDAAHRRGVVHCDIKPDNIFVTHAGRTVVTDFGLAAPELGGGTPGYMAPEQYTDALPSPTMDVYAWACVVVEILCGEPPFGTDPETAERGTVHDEPRLGLAAVTSAPGLAELLMRCLEKEPLKRPADGGDVLAALAVIMSLAPPLTVPTVRDVPAVEPPPALPAAWDQGGMGGPPAALPCTRIRLVVCPLGEHQWLFDLLPGDSVEVGRESPLALPDSQASRRHAVFWFDGVHLQVTDLGSMNGTYLNDQPISHGFAVPGDVVSIGSTTIAIEGGS